MDSHFTMEYSTYTQAKRYGKRFHTMVKQGIGRVVHHDRQHNQKITTYSLIMFTSQNFVVNK